MIWGIKVTEINVGKKIQPHLSLGYSRSIVSGSSRSPFGSDPAVYLSQGEISQAFKRNLCNLNFSL